MSTNLTRTEQPAQEGQADEPYIVGVVLPGGQAGTSPRPTLAAAWEAVDKMAATLAAASVTEPLTTTGAAAEGKFVEHDGAPLGSWVIFLPGEAYKVPQCDD